jgi:DNA replication protein DnaC
VQPHQHRPRRDRE